MASYRKVQNVAKSVTPPGPGLDKIVLKTMKTISDMVGSTLGPGGRSVLIERQEYGIAPIITKDGVTVHKSLGFQNSTQQLILEAARDAATKTADIAGDGTSTASVISSAIVHNMSDYLKDNPKVSPQKVIRELNSLFRNEIKPFLDNKAIKVEYGTPEGDRFLHAIARVSGNGDTELADAVMECFDLVGDAGNVTISEMSGPSGYKVERIEGFPIGIGFEDSCAKFFPNFLNDRANQRIFLEAPVFVLYHGSLTDIQTVLPLMNKIYEAWQSEKSFTHNVVVVATGFSEDVLGSLMLTFVNSNSLNVVPLVIPKSPILNGDRHLLEDLSSFTGARVLDPITTPLHKATLADLGRLMTSFESYRYRSLIVGEPDELLVSERVEDLKNQLASAESQLETAILNERIGKISGGIAKLKVVGSSNGELRERRDRVEDAVLAVRGAIKEGCLPGGGWALMRIVNNLPKTAVVDRVLAPSLIEPVKTLLTNSGLLKEEIDLIIEKMLSDDKTIYDAQNGLIVDPLDPANIIVDSLPAVSEAIRNSISIASLLGALGGVVAFGRDEELERQEAQETNNFLRQSGQETPEFNET